MTDVYGDLDGQQNLILILKRGRLLVRLANFKYKESPHNINNPKLISREAFPTACAGRIYDDVGYYMTVSRSIMAMFSILQQFPDSRNANAVETHAATYAIRGSFGRCAWRLL